MRIHNRKIFAAAIGICLFLLVMGETSAVPGNGLPVLSTITTSNLAANLQQTVSEVSLDGGGYGNLQPGSPLNINHWVENLGSVDVYVKLSYRLETPESSFPTGAPSGWSYDADRDTYFYPTTGLYVQLADDWIYSPTDDHYYYTKILKHADGINPGDKVPLFVPYTETIWNPIQPKEYTYTLRIPGEWTNETMGIPLSVVAVATAMQAQNVTVQFSSFPYWPV